jgi:hypothetical protein
MVDPVTGFRDRAWRPFAEPPLQQFAARLQATGPAPFPKTTDGLQSSARKGIQDSLHRATPDPRQFRDPFVPLSVKCQPQHFHPPLHPRIGMFEAFPCYHLALFFRELKIGASSHLAFYAATVANLLPFGLGYLPTTSPFSPTSICAILSRAGYSSTEALVVTPGLEIRARQRVRIIFGKLGKHKWF